jgi:predicted dehydrogenase
MSERIRWGILSTAGIAVKRFIPGAMASRNGEVVAIASRDGARAREIADRLGIPRAYASYDELLADPEVDAIYNPLPNSMHAEWTIACAAAGKPILCEKPLAVDAAQAQRMIDAARSHGVLLMEAFMYRFHPQHARVRELIDAGAIGEPRFVRSGFTFSLEPLDRKNVRLQSDLAGGALMDVGCYCVNASRMLFAQEPAWASAQWDFRDEFGVEVSLAGILGFSDGRTAVFDCGFRASAPSFYHVAGTTGTILATNAFTPPATEQLLMISAGMERREERIAGADAYRLEAEEFADALLEGRPPRIGAEDALGTLRAIAALRASAAAGGTRVPVEHA